MLERESILTFSLCESCIQHGKVHVDRDSCRCIPLLYCTVETERQAEPAVGVKVVELRLINSVKQTLFSDRQQGVCSFVCVGVYLGSLWYHGKCNRECHQTNTTS